MAAETPQGVLGNLSSLASSENEVLVHPSTYINRRLKHFAPTSKDFTPDYSTATPSSCKAKATTGSSIHNSGHSPSLNTTVQAHYEYDDPCSYSTLEESCILGSPQTSHLSVVYGLPGFGSTSLLVSLIVQIQDKHPDRWVCYMDLRKLNAILKRSGDHLDPNQWTMPRLIAAYNKLTCPTAVEKLEELFKSTSTDTSIPQPILAELFIDELDEIPPKFQDAFLQIINRDVSWKQCCSTRLWVATRNHLKPKMEQLFPEANVYELLPLVRNEQIQLLKNYWKHTTTVSDYILENFAIGVHNQMEKVVHNFYKTIGGCPTHLLLLPDFFTHLIPSEEKMATETKIKFSILEVSVAKVFEKFVKAKFEAYLDRISCEQPALAMSSMQFRDKELRKMERAHVKTIIASYPAFKCDLKTVFVGNSHQQEQAHELYRVGICYEENGQVNFLHKMYAEFILAQYFVDSGRLKNTSNLYISFFLNHILFDDECRVTRKFFDAYMSIQQERRKIRDVIIWTRIRIFLTKHYALNENVYASCSNEEDDAGSLDGQAPLAKLHYEDIKGSGSVLHLAMMEGHFKLAQMITDSFKGFPGELKKFLEITVNLEIFGENPFAEETSDCSPEVHTVDAFHLLALYGYGSDLERMLQTWVYCFGKEYTKKYFEDGTWTAVHYAAMNSNSHFLRALLSKDRKWGSAEMQIPVTHKNCDGQEPIHLIVNKCWFYSIKIQDHPHTDYKSCSTAVTAASPKTLAINEAINAVIPKAEPKSPATEDPNVEFSHASAAGSKDGGICENKILKIEPVVNDVIIKVEPLTLSTLSSELESMPQAASSTPRVTSGKGKKRQQAGSGSSRKKCKTFRGNKPLLVARRRSSTKILITSIKDIWCFEGVEKDFSAEWDLYPEDADWNPLQAHLQSVALLVENGADINAPNEVDGQTILHQVSGLQSVKFVKFLLQNGADVNFRDDFGKIPAEYAAQNGSVNVLEAITGHQLMKTNGQYTNMASKMS